MRARRTSDVQFRNETPFMRMMLSFMAGIVCQLFLPFNWQTAAACLMVLSFVVAFQTFYKKRTADYRLRWIKGLALLLAFFFSGALLTYLHSENPKPKHFSRLAGEKKLYLGRLIKPLTEKPGSYKTIVRVVATGSGDRWTQTEGNVLVYFARDPKAAGLRYGDLFCFSSFPVEVPPPRNPGQFNYQRFLSFHQVYHQVYLAGNRWIKLPANDGDPIVGAAYRVRDLFIGILKAHMTGHREFAVASALIIGYDDEVDQELLQAYSSAGALHVLSVSGMHVGLIYQGLLILLGFMTRKTWSRHLLYSFLLCFIWFYAFITGFSPSVARSALMISIVILATWHRGNSNVFNTMVVTALGLLIYNPFYITEVGFQLSFMAVWGILYFHPKIHLLWEPSNRILQWFWELTSISLAAQLMTFPLGLLYFHQFPNLFILSNLVVIPLSAIVIYLCIAVLVVSPVTFLVKWIAELTSWLIYLLNQSVLLIERVPGSVLDRISITVFETWLIYALLGAIAWFLISRRSGYLILFLFFLVVFNTNRLISEINRQGRKALIIYHVPGARALDLVYGNRHIFLADSSLLNNKASLLFQVEHNWWEMGMKNDSLLELETAARYLEPESWMISRNFIFFRGKTICLADSVFAAGLPEKTDGDSARIKIDYLVLSDNAGWRLKKIAAHVNFRQVIIDSSNSKRHIRKWKEQCLKMGKPCYAVAENGAYVVTFR